MKEIRLNVGLGMALLVLFVASFYVFGKTSDANAAAMRIVDFCSKEQDRSACYEREIPLLTDKHPLQEIFEIVRVVRKKDTSYQFCHVLAHELGERTVAEDPERWLDAIALNPRDGLCSNGFIHGVIGGKFRAEVLDGETLESLIPDFSRACEPRENWQASPLDQAICYHGMGHLYVFITDAQLENALALCEQTSVSASGSFRRVCIEGVFMQIYQPLEPDDFLMIERMDIKPTKETVRTFCSRFLRDEYEGACLRESWPYEREDLLNKPGAIDNFCAGQPNSEETQACYDTALSILGRQTLGQMGQAALICSALESNRKDECFGRVALAYLEEDRDDTKKAIDFCVRAPREDAAACLQYIADRAEFIYGDDRRALKSFCAALPVSIESRCVNASLQNSTSVSGVVHDQ